MKNIALLVYDDTLYGGAEKVALNLSNEFTNHYNVHLVSCFHKQRTPIVQLDSKVHRFMLSKEQTSLTKKCLSISKKLKEYLKSNHVDVLICITAGVNTIGIKATRGLKTKVIYAEHSNLLNKSYGKKHEIRQWIGAKFSDFVVTLTEKDKDLFIKNYNLKNKCDYIYNWFDGSISNNDYNIESRKIITVGRLEKVKGYDRLVEIAHRVLMKYPNWSWDIYGEGKNRENIEKMIKDYHLEDRLILKGNVSNITDLYSQYSFFVMTSYFEGLPLVLLEAKSSHLPIVSFDCPTGPSEIIKDNYDGFLVKNGNIEDIEEKIIALIENCDKRVEFSKHATDILNNFDKRVIIEKWLNIIDNLINN